MVSCDPNTTCLTCDDESASPLQVGNSNEENCGPFYDPDAALDVPYTVALGYFILMTGGKLKVPEIKKEKKKVSAANAKGLFAVSDGSAVEPEVEDEKFEEATSFEVTFDGDFEELPEHLLIAWLALTDGNVIDSCFGVRALGGNRIFRGKGATPAAAAAKNAKNQLLIASDSHHVLKILAIEAYGRCFEVIMEYHQEMEELGILGSVFCYRAKMISDKAREKLKEAFEYLTGAVEASM